jgi:spore maturation protein CgeB
LSYAEQLSEILGLSFGTSDAYAAGLAEAGHEAINLITNCAPLQTAWARERRRVPFARFALAHGGGHLRGVVDRQVFQRIVAAQLDEFDPDVVFIHDLWSISRSQLDRWRRDGRFLVGQIASPAPADHMLRGYDLLLSSFRHFVERFRALGVDAEYFRLAFYDRILDRMTAEGVDARPDGDRARGAVFIGGVDPRVHATGTAFLERVCKEVDVDVWGYGHEALDPSSPILRRFHGPVWGPEMYRVLASARVALNRHIDVAEGQANNMRLYESTGMGAMLLTDSGKGLGELFDVGSEVVAYEDVDDLVEKLRHYLDQDDERVRIARAGQQRTLAEHTYAERMVELAGLLEDRLGSSSRRSKIVSNQAM